jgi:hypothetical protein
MRRTLLLFPAIGLSACSMGCGTTTRIVRPITVAVSPTTASVGVGQTQAFTATVTGTPNLGLTWTLTQGGTACSPGCGTITPTSTTSGAATTYTAPAAPPAPGATVAITATSAADATISASATITITQNVVVQVSPSTASVPVGQTQQFTATVTGTTNTAVTWSVAGGATNGTITSSGLYTAPSTLPSPPQVTITATSVADRTKSASATVTIIQNVVVQVSPPTASVPVGQTQQFTATVTGTTNTSVTWSVAGGATNGTINASGLYTAPSTLPSPPQATVTATSLADPTKSASATVTITQGVSLSVSPTTATVVVAQTQPFTANVTGTGNTNVTWTLTQGGAACSPACGAIAPTSTASGVATTYTAPATVPPIPTVTVTATSVADTTKSASATVTVTSQSTGVVAVTPATASVEVFTTQQFSATINGQPTTAVTWQVNGTTGGNAITGTVSTSGLYSAPHSISNSLIQPNGAPVTVTITAVSTANTANSGSATVTLTVPGKSAENAPIELGTSGGNVLDFNTNGGNTTCCGGTLGSLLASGAAQFVLSADHVLARSGAGSPGEAIIQPGFIDTNCSSQGTKTVANLTQGSINLQNMTATTVDAAIAQVSSGAVDAAGNILMLGNAVDAKGVPVPGAPKAGPGQAPSVGLAVAKSGRTTGLTCSTIGSIMDTVNVQYSTNCNGTGQIFTITYSNQVDVVGGDFSSAGDSGSLIVTQSDATPVALLYADSKTDTVGNPVADVLNFFASNGNTVSFVGGSRGSGSTPQVIGCTLPGQQAAMKAGLAVQKVIPSNDALARAIEARDKHAAELLRYPEVQAVGVGASYDNPTESAILLFVLAGQRRSNLPAQVDRVRTRILEVEQFSQHGVLTAEESARLEQSAVPPQLVYPISDSEVARAKVVHAAHVDELMKWSGVQGVGITSSIDSPGEAALMIFLIQGMAHPTIPPVIDGLRTRVRESSRFRAGLGDHPPQYSCHVPRAGKWHSQKRPGPKTASVTREPLRQP